MSNRLGAKVKRLRELRGFSLSSLAQKAGLSKSTLYGIEECRVNPTINTIWAIANTLELSFGELVDKDVEISEGKLIVKLMEKNKHAEIYKMIVLDNASKISPPHFFGTTEDILVISGDVLVGELSNPVMLKAGEKCSINASVPHIYRGLSGYAVLIVSILYPQVKEKYFTEDRFLDVIDDKSINIMKDELFNGINILRIFPSKKYNFQLSKHRGIIIIDNYKHNKTIYLSSVNKGAFGNTLRAVRRYNQIQYRDFILRVQKYGVMHAESFFEKLLLSELKLMIQEPMVCETVFKETVKKYDDIQKLNYIKETPFEQRIDVGLYSIFEYFHPGYITQALLIGSFLNSLKRDGGELEVLDVGSGFGQHIQLINSISNRLKFHCVERSPFADSFLSKIDNVVDVIQEDFTLMKKGKSYKNIISVGSLHNMSLNKFLGKSYELLDTEGFLIICDEFISPFDSRESREQNLILHHTSYMIEAMVDIEGNLSKSEENLYNMFRESIPYSRYLALNGEIDEAKRILYVMFKEIKASEPIKTISKKFIVYYIFMILELEKLVTGLDYKEERKTFAGNFIAAANDIGFSFEDKVCFHPTSNSSGTYFIVLKKDAL